MSAASPARGCAAAPRALVFLLHAMSAWVLAAIWPFARLVHVWSAPVAYLWRPHVVHRRRPALSRKG
ncbi:respiratory nitrate reductase subunit gamma [Nonomuraea sp. NPDC048826]|uniref:respiratory nitrate reductase subunit gamma n=1 Tax=Nonomuraea sp. NPDC048826 TaxID=3364347 RepID=UPI00370FD9CB